MKKILFLTTEIPFPLDSGGKIRTFNMLKGISQKYEIDLICFSEKKLENLELKNLKEFCKDIKVVNKIFTNNKSKSRLFINLVKSLFTKTPFVVKKFEDKSYREIIKQKIRDNSYDLILFDHLQTTIYLDEFKNYKVILSQHNCEYLILKRRYEEEKSIIKRAYIKNQYLKTEEYEKIICSKFNKVIMLTEEDKSYLINSKYNGSNIEIVPISIENNYQKKHYNKEVKNLLFIGTMTWYPNEQGVIWFLNNVWSLIVKKLPYLKLYVVGKSPSEDLLKYKSKNVVITGYVDDVNLYIDKCDVCIVPLFIGGGMRVKILECMSKGIPLISTSVGAEGIKVKNKKDILIANNEEEFIESIEKLIGDRELYDELVINSKNVINENYSIKFINKKLLNLINDAIKK